MSKQIRTDPTFIPHATTTTSGVTKLSNVISDDDTVSLTPLGGKLLREEIFASLGAYNEIETFQNSGGWIVPRTGWFKVTCIGGGAGGGAGGGNITSGNGGKAGGDTSFKELKALGGSPGAGAGSFNIQADYASIHAAGGPGSSGEVVTDFMFLVKDEIVQLVIGEGGEGGSPNGPNSHTGQDGQGGINPGKGGTRLSCGQAGGAPPKGVCGQQSINPNAIKIQASGSYGGAGGSNSTGFGSGGGGGAGSYDDTVVDVFCYGGPASGNGQRGGDCKTSGAAVKPDGNSSVGGWGGDGGPGAIIIEYYNSNKITGV